MKRLFPISRILPLSSKCLDTFSLARKTSLGAFSSGLALVPVTASTLDHPRANDNPVPGASPFLERGAFVAHLKLQAAGPGGRGVFVATSPVWAPSSCLGKEANNLEGRKEKTGGRVGDIAKSDLLGPKEEKVCHHRSFSSHLGCMFIDFTMEQARHTTMTTKPNSDVNPSRGKPLSAKSK